MPCHHDDHRRGDQEWAVRPEAAARAVLATATALQDTHPRGTTAYAYAAGVEDALGWLVGQVTGEVFRGFSPAMAPLTAAAHAGRSSS